MTTYPGRPLLATGEPRLTDDGIELSVYGVEYTVEHPRTAELMKLLSALNGHTPANALADVSGLSDTEVDEALTQLDEAGFIDDPIEPHAPAGIDVMFRIEDELNRLFSEQVESSHFWQALIGQPEAVPENVYYGMAIENWHFLYREHLFDSAVLTYPNNRAARAHLNEFYIEEHRHDDIVLRAFEPLGITPEQIRQARPLPSTTALVNGLAWWARTDPLFFFCTISVLEGGLGGGGDTDSFIEACLRKGLSSAFVGPLQAHARINNSHEHGLVSREIFDMLPAVNPSDENRLRAQCRLFMELYRNFYDGILDYYSQPGHPLLRVLPSVRAEVD